MLVVKSIPSILSRKLTLAIGLALAAVRCNC